MKQQLGQKIDLAVRTVLEGAPAADGDGTDVTGLSFKGKSHQRVRLRVDIGGGATSTELTLWLKDRAITAGSGKWGVPVSEAGALGTLGGGVALPAGRSYFFDIDDIGLYAEACLVQGPDVGGTPVVTAELFELLETQD